MLQEEREFVHRSITCMTFIANGNANRWKSSLQKMDAFTTTEAEYIALSEAIHE